MPTFAEDVTFIKEYSYQASEADSKLSARAIALEQVKRLLLEELGTYLISETEVKNFQLTKDKITTLSAGVVATQIIEDKWNGEVYYLKAKIKSDPKEVTKGIDNLRKDKQKDKELEDSKNRADEAFAELARLRKELEVVKGDKQKQAEYKMAANVLSAKDWFEKGDALKLSGDNQGAVDAYSRAIELDPKYADAYNNRGIAYDDLGDNKRAIADYDRAVELNPKGAYAFANRGNIYAKEINFKRALDDYNRATELDPKNAHPYTGRGIVYRKLGETGKAIVELDKAIELNPKQKEAYDARAAVYFKLGNRQQAIQDVKAAAVLGSKYAQDWLRKQEIEW